MPRSIFDTIDKETKKTGSVFDQIARDEEPPSQWSEALTAAEELPGQLVRGAWSRLQDVGHIANPMRDPQGALDAAQRLVEPRMTQAQQAVQSYKDEDYLAAFGHGLATVVPGGPAAAETGEEYKRGEYGKAGVGTAALLGPALFDMVPEEYNGHRINVPKTKLREAKEAVKAKADWFFTKDPRILATKWLGPVPANSMLSARDNVTETGRLIKKHAGGKPITSNDEALVAANKAFKEAQDAHNVYMERARKNNVRVDGNQIVKAISDAIPKTAKPRLIQNIVADANRLYGGKRLTVDEIDTFRDELTNSIDDFYKRHTGDQIAAMGGDAPVRVKKAARDALAKELNRAIDHEHNGEEAHAIQITKARLIDFINGMERRENMATASKPASPWDAAKGAIPRLWAAARGDSGGIGYVRAGADASNVGTIWAGSIDPWVKQFFESIGDTAPQPYTAPGPWTVQKARNRLLGPSVSGGKPLITPAPPGSTPVSGPLPRTYPKGSGTNRLLGPPTQIQQPGMNIRNTVPITDPVTGKLTYVPEHWAEGQIPAQAAMTGEYNPPPTASADPVHKPPAVSNRTATGRQSLFGQNKLTPEQARARETLRSGQPHTPPVKTLPPEVLKRLKQKAAKNAKARATRAAAKAAKTKTVAGTLAGDDAPTTLSGDPM